MEFEQLFKEGFTVYSKSGCPNCIKVKALLKEKNLLSNIIECDDYLIDNKEAFLLFVKELADKDCKLFPIVFYKSEFVGGYNETKILVDTLFLSFEENITF